MDNHPTYNTNKLWNRFFITVCISLLFSNFCLQCLNTVKALYVDDLGGATTFVSLISLIGLFCTILMRLLSGWMSDVTGKRTVAIIGLTVYIFAMLGFAFTPSLNMLIVFSAFQSLSYSMSATALSALTADVIPRSRMGEGIGYSGLTNSLASAIGPSFALALVNTSGYTVLFISNAVFLALSALFVFFCKYEKSPLILAIHENDAKSVMEALPNSMEQPTGIRKWLEPKAIPCAIISTLVNLPMGFIISFFSLYGTQNAIPNFALYFTFSAVAMVLARLLLGKLSDKYGNLIVVAPGLVLYALSFVLVLIAPGRSALVIYAAGALYGLSNGMIAPALNACAIKQVTPDRRGAATGTFYISFDIGIAGGSALWGLTIDKLGYNVTIWACICICIAAFLASFIILRKK